MGSDSKNLQRSQSVSTLKLLGQKLLNTKSHDNAQYLDNSSTNGITPLRRKPTSSKPNSSKTATENVVTDHDTRHRSSSIFSRLNNNGSPSGNGSPTTIRPVKSSAAIVNLMAHSSNPFVKKTAVRSDEDEDENGESESESESDTDSDKETENLKSKDMDANDNELVKINPDDAVHTINSTEQQHHHHKEKSPSVVDHQHPHHHHHRHHHDNEDSAEENSDITSEHGHHHHHHHHHHHQQHNNIDNIDNIENSSSVTLGTNESSSNALPHINAIDKKIESTETETAKTTNTTSKARPHHVSVSKKLNKPSTDASLSTEEHHKRLPHRSKSFATHSLSGELALSNLDSSSSRNSSQTNLIYNPYGLNPNAPSRPGTAFAETAAQDGNDLSFYLHDGNEKIRMLPLPIANPNDWLPENLHQYSITLSDNFVFDPNNKPIGSGGSSEVRKVRSSFQKKDVYALKKLNMIYHETPDKFYKRCSKEFVIAKQLSHSIHITCTFELVKVPTTTYTTRGWGFVMELGKCDLFQLIEKTGWKSVPVNEKYCIFKQIANGIKFCHDNGVAHRDIKPENVLLSPDGVCKLTDFGISCWSHEIPDDFTSPIKLCEGMLGSPPFTPPEVMYFDSKKHYPEKFQKPFNPLSMDTYALGIMLYTLVNNVIPFIESCNTDARFRDYDQSYNNFIQYQNKTFRVKGSHKAGPGAEYSMARNFQNGDASRVAWRLADPDYETRYTMEDLFEDPWFQSIQTCVDPDDHSYITKRPMIKVSSVPGAQSPIPDAAPGSEVASVTSLVSGSPQPSANPHESSVDDKSVTSSVKPRSMVEIAQAPIKPKTSKKVKDLSKPSDNISTLDPALKSRLNKMDIEDAQESVDNILDKVIPSTPSDQEITKDGGKNVATENKPDIAALSKKLTSASISSNASVASPNRTTANITTPATKKLVIHHHLDITNSVVSPMSFSNVVSR